MSHYSNWHSGTNKCKENVIQLHRITWVTYLGGLVVRGAEAFDRDLSEDVGLQRLLSQVAVVNDGWMPENKNFHWTL